MTLIAAPPPDGNLASKADGGDAKAQFNYALELLGGGQAAAEGPRAIELIESASAQGHPEAIALCALFHAMGAGRPQSWHEAFGHLERAAAAGSATAQGQLAILKARGLSAEQLLAVPQRQVLSESPRIIAFPGFATPEECDWAIEQARERLERATVFNTDTGDQVYDSTRDNSSVEFQLAQMDVVLEVLRARIAAATHLPVPIFEPLQVLHYAVGEQFHPHNDFLDPDVPEFADLLQRFGQRIATVLIYLNDDYEGGETVFPKLGIRYRGRRGDALFFTNVDRVGRPDRMTTHAGKPPTSGEKWIISQWIRDRAPMSPFAGGATGTETKASKARSSVTKAAPSTISYDEAVAAFDAGKAQAVLDRIGQTLRSGSTDARLWHLHGLILRQMERREDAIPSLRKAAELAPNGPRIAHALARTLFEAGLPSLEAYGRALKLSPTDTEILAGMTSAFAAEGEADAAIAGLERILSRSPHWVDGHILLAKLRWAQGERDGFARSFEAAVAAMPGNMDLWREWLIALLHAEHWDEVARIIAKGRATVGDNAIFAVNEAILAADIGECDRAEKLFAPFVDIGDATVQVRRVRHYLRWGRPADADAIIGKWSGKAEAFMFWPYASLAWRMLDDPRWQWLEGDERFVGVYDIADRLPPLDRLADTLRNLHSLKGQPLEQSLRGGTQTEGDIFMHVDPVLIELREAIRTTVAEHVAQLPAPDESHPLLGPPRGPIRFSGAWSVWLKSGGFHANHVHPAGWISSALYVVLPPDVGQNEAGFLTLGEATAPTFKVDVPPFRTIEPKPGRLALFPSYMWHGTRPFGEGERITVAFDVAVPNGS